MTSGSPEGIRELSVLRTDSKDPYHNLALEDVLLRRILPGQCVLYLWQNQRTVVIGRNQDAAAECRVRVLEADGGHLARRLSGGGAVYHDLGNLNFTFLLPTAVFDLERQTGVILEAVRSLGIPAEKTGRNDLTAEGRKFSGHAYYHSAGRSSHHGTLMVRVDPVPLEKYLNVSPGKLRSKGVPSVRARVANLSEYRPDLTVEDLAAALTAAFRREYGLPVRDLREEDLDAGLVQASAARFSSPEWIFGVSSPLEHSREARFSWGSVRLDFSENGRIITEAALWSDGLDADFLEAVPSLLRGCPSDPERISARLQEQAPDCSSVIQDLVSLLTLK